MARIAVDAMGGDLAPGEIVAGTLLAAERTNATFVLVGREPEVAAVLSGRGAGRIEVVHAPDVVEMDEHDPAKAVRRRRETSVSTACRLVKQREADAVFSAGSTGAAMAAAVLEIGRLKGVSRPAIATVLPFPGRPTILLDSGANADVRPEQLASFAVLGSMFAEVRLGVDKPRVGLLSIGEEPGKGNELVKEAYPLIDAAGLNFVGNVEGRDLTAGAADVVVTDGFTGNVALKLMEGMASFLMGELIRVCTRTSEANDAFAVLAPGLLELKQQLSVEATGGAQLLGVEGVCIIGHGSSTRESVASALEIAARTADSGFVSRLSDRLRAPATGD